MNLKRKWKRPFSERKKKRDNEKERREKNIMLSEISSWKSEEIDCWNEHTFCCNVAMIWAKKKSDFFSFFSFDIFMNVKHFSFFMQKKLATEDDCLKKKNLFFFLFLFMASVWRWFFKMQHPDLGGKWIGREVCVCVCVCVFFFQPEFNQTDWVVAQKKSFWFKSFALCFEIYQSSRRHTMPNCVVVIIIVIVIIIIVIFFFFFFFLIIF